MGKPLAKERRDTRLRFEQWARNPSCRANTVSAVHNVSMAKVAVAEGLPPTMGQSPFALARGNTFERTLFRDDTLLKALVKAGVLPEGATGFVDLRTRQNGGPLASLDEAVERTRDLLRDPRGTSLVAAATLVIPRRVMLPEAVLIVDALAIRHDGPRPRLIVGEVKTYPDRGGHTDGGELALARAQAGLYLHALQVTTRGLDLDLSNEGFLVLSRPGSNQPSVRAGEDLRYQAERARRGFDLLEAAAAALEPVGADPVQAVREADVAYTEACLAFCDRASGCHARALAAGDPGVLGEDVRRFLGSVDLPRALQLLEGAAPKGPAEADLVERLDALREVLP